MPQYRVSRLLPYTCEQLFALVLDIERYPEFVPAYRQVRILCREVAALQVEQRVGFGPLVVNFRSRAEFAAPARIFIRASDGPFRRLDVTWQFTPEGAGCRVSAETHYELTGVLASAMHGGLALMASRLLDAFARRAAQLYRARG
jgi:coenzyme Q-binding protein COQ10